MAKKKIVKAVSKELAVPKRDLVMPTQGRHVSIPHSRDVAEALPGATATQINLYLEELKTLRGQAKGFGLGDMVECRFTGTDVLPLTTRDVANFLNAFTDIYAGALSLGVEEEHVGKDVSLFSESPMGIQAHEKVSIEIRSISYNSPFEIVLVAIPVAVAAATILSGGKLKVSASGIEATLVPLGVGVAALKEALTMGALRRGLTEKERRNLKEIEVVREVPPTLPAERAFQSNKKKAPHNKGKKKPAK